MTPEHGSNGHNPEFSKQTWESLILGQVEKNIDLGYHSAIGEAENDYRRSFILPVGFRQPEDYSGRFDNLLVVDPRVPLSKRNNALNVTEYINPEDIVDINETPNAPYAIWVGRLGDKDFDSENVLANLSEDEVPLNYQEALSYYAAFPGALYYEGVVAASSRYENLEVPVIKNLLNVAALTRASIKDKYARSRIITRGKDIILLGK